MKQGKSKPKLEDIKGVKFTTPVFRASFPNLFEPKQYQGKGDPYYNISMLFSKDQDLSEMKKKIIDAGVEAFGADRKKWPNVSLPWRDGDEKADYEGYAGMFYCSAKTKNKPVVVDRQKNRIDKENESEIYGGCYARAVVVAKATESGGNYFITLYLQAVQKVKDGEQFGSGVNIDSDFDDLDDSDSSDDPDNYEDGSDDDMGF